MVLDVLDADSKRRLDWKTMSRDVKVFTSGVDFDQQNPVGSISLPWYLRLPVCF